VLGSTVAHHHGVGRGRGDCLTVTPLLTASLGLEPDPLADQFTLTGATGANGLELESSGGECLGGGGGEVHRWLVAVGSVAGGGGCPSVTVADVPTVGSRGRCLIGALGVCFEDRLTACLLGVHLGGVLCHDGGHVEFGLGHVLCLN